MQLLCENNVLVEILAVSLEYSTFVLQNYNNNLQKNNCKTMFYSDVSFI